MLCGMPTTTTATLTLRLPASTLDALRRAAEDEDRPMSSLARRIIAEWLRKHGK